MLARAELDAFHVQQWHPHQKIARAVYHGVQQYLLSSVMPRAVAREAAICFRNKADQAPNTFID